MSISCIVMASGMSRRMGENKLTLKINGKMVFEYILDEIKKIDFDEVIVVTRFKEIKDYSRQLGYRVIENKDFEKGQSSSIKLGIKNAKKENGYIFFVADQPKLKASTINKVLENYKEDTKEIIIPYFNGEKGNPIIFSKYYRDELLKLKGDIGGSPIIKKYGENIVKVAINSNENIDIDNEEDYKKIRSEYEK